MAMFLSCMLERHRNKERREKERDGRQMRRKVGVSERAPTHRSAFLIVLDERNKRRKKCAMSKDESAHKSTAPSQRSAVAAADAEVASRSQLAWQHGKKVANGLLLSAHNAQQSGITVGVQELR